jgi:ribosomal protein S17E
MDDLEKLREDCYQSLYLLHLSHVNDSITKDVNTKVKSYIQELEKQFELNKQELKTYKDRMSSAIPNLLNQMIGDRSSLYGTAHNPRKE